MTGFKIKKYLRDFYSNSTAGGGGGTSGIVGVDTVVDILLPDVPTLETGFPAADNDGRYAVVDIAITRCFYY